MRFSKKQSFIIFGIFITLNILAILTLLTQLPIPEKEPMINEGMYAFYTLFNGNRVIIFFFIGLVISAVNILPIIYYKQYNNNFLSFICTRITYKSYLIKVIIKVFLLASIFYLLLNISILLMIHLFYTPINFQLPDETYLIFFDQQILNLISYCVLSSIGFGIYNVFLISLIPYIKNEFLYRAISLINFIIGLLGYIVIKPLFAVAQSFGSIINTIASFIVPLNLYTPGLLLENDGFLAFGISTLFYGTLTFILFKISYRKVTKNG